MNAGGLLPDSTYVDVDKLPWEKTRFPGIDCKTLMEDKASGMATLLMRWAPGARLPQHEHVEIEQSYVLAGSLADQAGVCRAGQYVWRRAGSRHDAWTDEGCLVLAVFLKPNKFFDQ
ncbi:MAG TPA: cupin domain-containing protein [Reyranella sp.]|jgi:anti-sigma factor ChrR (cupin superfamily)|nr:cupin domain-containing protein [Reyranella sp.]